ISGETLDYGPCAFIDKYEPDTYFSSIDTNGRYRYKNQPSIGQWNLSKLGETLIPLLDEDNNEAVRKAQESLDKYPFYYQRHYTRAFRDIYLTSHHKLRIFEDSEFINWFEKYQACKKAQDAKKDDINIVMNGAKPSFIPRNHLVQNAVDQAVEGHYGEVKQLLKAVSKPYNDKLGDKYIGAPGEDDINPNFKTYCGT